MKQGFLSTRLGNRLQLIKHYGWRGAGEVAKNDRMKRNCEMSSDERYGQYIRSVEPGLFSPVRARGSVRFSVVMPVGSASSSELLRCLHAFSTQTYGKFDLLLALDRSGGQDVRDFLFAEKNSGRKKISCIVDKEDFSEAVNGALAAADGEFLIFCDCRTIVSPCALQEVAAYLKKHPETDFVYGDEDHLTEDGLLRQAPVFKPDWSPDFFWSAMYTGRLAVCRASLVKAVGGVQPGYGQAWEYDLLMRSLEKSSDARVGHVAKVLSHSAHFDAPGADSGKRDEYFAAEKRLKEEALARRGIQGSVETERETGCSRIIYETKAEDLVSVIVPSRDNPKVLKKCLDSILALHDGIRKEIIVVDNGSAPENRAEVEAYTMAHDIRYLYEPAEFNFSAMVNRGAGAASGNFLLFLNDDTEVKEKDSVSRMLGQAGQKWTGAVGARLLYPDGLHIQHLGIINIATGPSHAFLQETDDHRVSGDRNRIEHDYLAVTAACLMVAKEKYREVGGFDEALKVSYNDVDFCFALYEHGYYNVVRNDAVFLHYESLSRGKELTPEKAQQMEEERAILYRKHPKLEKADPFYNVNLEQGGVYFGIGLPAPAPALSYRPDYFRNPGSFKCTIDTFFRDVEQLAVEVSGWYDAGGGKTDNGRRAVVLLAGGGETLCFAAEKVVREDIHAYFKNSGVTDERLSLISTGFHARISCPPQGVWKLFISLSFGREWKFIDTGKKITVS